MVRPNKAWEKKYGKQARTEQRRTLLDGSDTIPSAINKLACGVDNAESILLMALRPWDKAEWYVMVRLVDADDIGLHGQKIVRAYHEWAKNDYEALIKGLADRDQSLVNFVKSI